MHLEFNWKLSYYKQEVVQVPRDESPDKSILRTITFVSKNLCSTEKRYSNIERGVLGILYTLKKFHHYLPYERDEYNYR